MITEEEIKNFITDLPDAFADMPFEDFSATVFRRKSNKKWFGIIMPAPESYFKRYGVKTPQDNTVLTLKCPPDLKDFLTESFQGGILPAYHMNKTHWISIIICSSVPAEDVKKLVLLSYKSVVKEKK